MTRPPVPRAHDRERPTIAALCVVLLQACSSTAVPEAATSPADDRTQQPAEAAAITYRDYPRKPTVLSEDEAELVGEQVMARCGVTPGANHLPWYYFYELGLELAKRGDPQRALDALVAATDRRPRPENKALMYGMWFVSYLPYFEIARLHYQLDNFSCAWDAMHLSERYGEVRDGDPRSRLKHELVQDLQAVQPRQGRP